jgi:hypothetical protein
MRKKSRHPNFDQALELLRGQGFEVSGYGSVASGMLVTKHGAGAVLVPIKQTKGGDDPSAAFAIAPGVMVRGEVGRLLDRGYQKFIKSSQYELPASAHQLQGIHAFSEELKRLTGATSLYNESLGTTSDVYRYDRLKGRGPDDPEPAQPWALTDGH